MRLLINDHNLGQFQNRNKAASLANGKYIKFLDSDDIIYPHGLETMINAMERFPKAAFGIQGNLSQYEEPYPFMPDNIEAIKKHFLSKAYFVMGSSATIFNREIFLHEKGYLTDFTGADIEILLRFAVKYCFVIFPPSLIWWRQHNDQEILKGLKSHSYLVNDYNVSRKFLRNPDLPFSLKEKRKAMIKLNNLYIGKMLRLLIRIKLLPIYLILTKTGFISGLKYYFILGRKRI